MEDKVDHSQTVRNNGRLVEHWAMYGKEFEAQSGIYLLEIDTNKNNPKPPQWSRVGELKQFDHPVALTDMLKTFDKYGFIKAVYWNACRQNMNEAPYQFEEKVKNPTKYDDISKPENVKYADEMKEYREDLENQWEKEYDLAVDKLIEFKTFWIEDAKKWSIKKYPNDQAAQKMYDEFLKEVEETCPTPQRPYDYPTIWDGNNNKILTIKERGAKAFQINRKYKLQLQHMKKPKQEPHQSGFTFPDHLVESKSYESDTSDSPPLGNRPGETIDEDVPFTGVHVKKLTAVKPKKNIQQSSGNGNASKQKDQKAKKAGMEIINYYDTDNQSFKSMLFTMCMKHTYSIFLTQNDGFLFYMFANLCYSFLYI